MRKQELRDLAELFIVRAQDLLATPIGRVDRALHFIVNDRAGLLGIGLRALIAAPDEDLAALIEGHRAEAVAHAEARDHIMRQAAGALQIA